MSNFQFLLLLLAASPLLFILLLIGEALVARSGPREEFVNPERKTITLGSGDKKINYVVLGDSTSAGQGADYEKGIAMSTTQELAKKYAVSFTNLSISGATTGDLLSDQVKAAVLLKPDLVLISISANDLTNLTSTTKLKNDLQLIVDQLVAAHCKVKIVLTGTPDMGSLPRFAQPLRYIAGLRTKQLNQGIEQIIRQNNLTLAPIAKETGPVFRADSTLFASDRYHPNERGYAVWIPVLNKAIDEALQNQPEHCK